MSETLRQLMNRGPVGFPTALNILGQLLNALEFAHWRGVIYGDITPENITLTSTGEATLAESAGAHAGEESAPTQADAAGAVPGYLAPEQIEGKPVDGRADIFALGVIAYEMLTGKHPFGTSDGLSAGSVIDRIVHKPPLAIPQATLTLLDLPPHIPPVLDVALAKDPKDRFPDAISFLDALKGTTAAAGVTVTEEPRLTRAASLRSFRSRRKWLIYLVLGALGIVVLVVVLVVALGGNSDPSSSTTESSGGTTSTGPSVSAITPATTATSIAPTTTIATTTTTIAATTTTAIATTTTTIAPTRAEQVNSNLLYTGTWTTVPDVSASGGSFQYANSSGASVSVTFKGTYLAWIAKKGPAYGKARLTVDNQAPVIVDLYSATTLWRAKAWESGALPLGTHTVKIEWTGTKNAAATDTNISVDAFDVAGSLTQVP